MTGRDGKIPLHYVRRNFSLVTTSKLRKAQLTRSRSAWEFAKLPFRFAKPRFLRLGGKGDTAHRNFGPWPDGTGKTPIRVPFADWGYKGGCRPAQARGAPRKVLCPAFCERKLAGCGAAPHGLSGGAGLSPAVTGVSFFGDVCPQDLLTLFMAGPSAPQGQNRGDSAPLPLLKRWTKLFCACGRRLAPLIL